MKNVIVKIEGACDPLCERALSIFKDRIMSRCNACVSEGSDGAAMVLDDGSDPYHCRVRPPLI